MSGNSSNIRHYVCQFRSEFHRNPWISEISSMLLQIYRIFYKKVTNVGKQMKVAIVVYQFLKRFQNKI